MSTLLLARAARVGILPISTFHARRLHLTGISLLHSNTKSTIDNSPFARHRFTTLTEKSTAASPTHFH
ncbi:hypothetical protein HanRHA438_Chr01g0030711 [Helianthus annuus]|nr:hypothetical protein HanRHA438_Chr01g0030711 [Helianthus annuus]